jgi:thymidylate synthase
MSGRVKEVTKICQGIKSVKSVRKKNTLLWEEDEYQEETYNQRQEEEDQSGAGFSVVTTRI